MYYSSNEQKLLDNNNYSDSEDDNSDNSSDYWWDTTYCPLNTRLIKKMSVSFCGSGLLGFYHMGVAYCLRRYAPLCEDIIACGSSSGSLAAIAFCLNIPLEWSIAQMLKMAKNASSKSLGLLDPNLNLNAIIYNNLNEVLSKDCHKRASGRLYLSLTRVSDGKNVVVSQFDSREDLIRAIQCSCFIPLASGCAPLKFQGKAYIDGAFSNNFPIIDQNTIKVSPLSGETDICPQDEYSYPYQFDFYDNPIMLSPTNLLRMRKMVIPDHPSYYLKLCQQGFDDTIRFLLRNNIIRCNRCLNILLLYGTEYEEQEFISKGNNENLDLGCDVGDVNHSAVNCANCEDCHYKRQIAVYDSLPENVVKAVQKTCDRMNKGIAYWLFENRPMKLLSLLSTPYTLPMNLTWSILNNVLAIRTEPKNSLFSIIIVLRSIMSLGNNANNTKRTLNSINNN